MQMLYNSDNYVVVQFEVPTERSADDQPFAADTLTRGGYEIVDKFARREIFIEGALAERFKQGVAALIDTQPTEDEMDAFIEGFTPPMQHPLLVH